MIPTIETTSPRSWATEHIFGLIESATAMSRPALVACTGLSASTVSHAVTRLIEAGRVIEGDRPRKEPGSGRGRPARTLRALADPSIGAAISFGTAQIEVAIGDVHGTVLSMATIKRGPNRTIRDDADLACDQVEELCQAHDVSELKGVVAGLGSLPMSSAPRTRSAAPAWPAQELSKRLSQRLRGVPVELDTRMSMATYGELRLGAGRRHENFIVWQPGEPAEVGMVLNGQIYRGGIGLAGRLPSAKGLADSIAGICNFLNPTAVVVAYDRSEVLSSVIRVVRQSIDAIALPPIAATVEVIAGELGADAGIRGGLLRACCAS